MIDLTKISSNKKFLLYVVAVTVVYGSVNVWYILPRNDDWVAYLLSITTLALLVIAFWGVIFAGYKIIQKLTPKINPVSDHIKRNFDIYLFFSLYLAFVLSSLVVFLIGREFGFSEYPGMDSLIPATNKIKLDVFVNLPLTLVILMAGLIRTIKNSTLSNWRWLFLVLFLKMQFSLFFYIYQEALHYIQIL